MRSRSAGPRPARQLTEVVARDFRQGDTDMICIATSVKVTGETGNHKYFQGRNPITTAGCNG